MKLPGMWVSGSDSTSLSPGLGSASKCAGAVPAQCRISRPQAGAVSRKSKFSRPLWRASWDRVASDLGAENQLPKEKNNGKKESIMVKKLSW